MMHIYGNLFTLFYQSFVLLHSMLHLLGMNIRINEGRRPLQKAIMDKSCTVDVSIIQHMYEMMTKQTFLWNLNWWA